MLFMIVERFRNADYASVGERFRARGRLIPEGAGVEFVTSWMTTDGAACYQVMRAPDASALAPWIAAWADLVEFEVVEVEESARFWERVRGEG